MKSNNDLIGVIGDLHWKDELSYADYISDRRVGEKKEILDFIVDSFKDCQNIVFLGDNFNSKNNSSESNREFVEFIERFGDKQVYMISGNHCKKGNGSTAIDFLGEVKKDNWHIFTKLESIDIGSLKVDFLPYMLNQELEAENTEIASKKLNDMLKGGDILFAHHAISGTVFHGVKAEELKEVILDRDILKDKYKLAVAGHIHSPQMYGNIVITGNVFTTEVNETKRYIHKIKKDLSIEVIDLPGREIHKIENPTEEQLSSIPKSAIVKAVLTDKKMDPEKMKEQLSKFDAHLLIEDYPTDRKKMHIEEGAFDFSTESVLKLYAEAKGIDHQKLLKGLQLINQ